MPELYTPTKLTIGEILSTASVRIEVPQWQRNYSWRSKEVNAFFDDIVDFSERYKAETIVEQEYFLGSIVRVDRGSFYELLDGQQRLATSTIMLAVIRDFVQPTKRDAASHLQHDYIVKTDYSTGSSVHKLTLNEYDRAFFRAEIQDFNPDTSPQPTKQGTAGLESHGLIRKAKELLAQKLSNRAGTMSANDAYQWALRLQRVLTGHVSVVAITSKDEDSAASVFETLNDRGIGLSTPDLTRNLVMMRAQPADRTTIVGLWRDVLETDVDNFLRHYWQSYNGDVKTRSLYHEIKNEISSTNRSSLEFTRDLQRLARVYQALLDGDADDDRYAALLDGIALLNAKSLFPALLAGNDALPNAADRLSLLEGLMSLYVRHNVIGNLDNSRLESKLFTVAKELRAEKDLKATLKSLREFGPGDEDFARSFEQARIARASTARFILRELEQFKRPTQELKLQTSQFIDVEHIYPKNPPNRWLEHDDVLYRLGNQTLLAKGENRGIKNREFAHKKTKYAGSEVLLTKELADYQDWSPETIASRQAEMAKHALQIW